jgi:hypothetical protein
MSTRMPYNSEDIAEGPEKTQQDTRLLGGQKVLADPKTQDSRH